MTKRFMIWFAIAITIALVVSCDSALLGVHAQCPTVEGQSARVQLTSFDIDNTACSYRFFGRSTCPSAPGDWVSSAVNSGSRFCSSATTTCICTYCAKTTEC